MCNAVLSRPLEMLMFLIEKIDSIEVDLEFLPFLKLFEVFQEAQHLNTALCLYSFTSPICFIKKKKKDKCRSDIFSSYTLSHTFLQSLL